LSSDARRSSSTSITPRQEGVAESRSPQGSGSMLAFYRGQTAARTHTHAAQVQGLCHEDVGSLCQHPARLVGKVN
jgi:hypothetical protein